MHSLLYGKGCQQLPPQWNLMNPMTMLYRCQPKRTTSLLPLQPFPSLQRPQNALGHTPPRQRQIILFKSTGHHLPEKSSVERGGTQAHLAGNLSSLYLLNSSRKLKYMQPYRTITYTGSYNPSGTGFLSIHGWTRDPLIEYFMVEAYIPQNPALQGERKGSIQCDGDSYDVYLTKRVNQTSIDGHQDFSQFWSVRNPPRALGSIGGKVTVNCHFNSWANMGMHLGSRMNFQRVDVETNRSSVSATISFSG